MKTIFLLLWLMVIAAFFVGLTSIKRDRKYKSGTTWCFWRWTDVDSEYILRLHVFKTPWFAVCLHWINKPDAEPWLHDHPVAFFSLILRGGYAELRQRVTELKPRHIVHRWFNFIRANDFDRHTIVFTRTKTLTLALMGPKVREWGFHTPAGWIMWKDYYKMLRDGLPVRERAYWEARAVVPREPNQLEIFNAELQPHLDAMMIRYCKQVGAVPAAVVDETTRIIDEKPPALPELVWQAEDGSWWWRSEIDKWPVGPCPSPEAAEAARKSYLETIGA